ncbi:MULTISPECIES: hypothetical protein [unclassified Paenibacillus]|uniref:hypothetical protein n=1 Tax=unclassified Paenibacillus TaxID=185978 RepID=UPI0003E2732F|nr:MULTISPECIES: hypothetical protein [unclassified Paenibacillus]ETT47241.1 hypothetical protein C162_18068 [Paenibacillus sp. FSL R7-269]OMF89220.1 hypothetical protein BK147_25580 [Paenibacillus sp. FSL R7-0337]
MIKKRRWLTFLLAMVPGLGHMYLGFKKLGLEYMIGASLCIIFIPSMPAVFPFALAALWFYQLFDALQKAAWMKVSAAEHERMMFHPDSFGAPWSMGMSAPPMYPHDDVNPVWVGIGCVIAGILLLLITAFPALWEILSDMNIGAILLSLALIGYGFRMLKNNSKV